MSLASLQHIEKIFGSIVCALLHLPAKFIPRPKDPNPDQVQKLLVVKFFGIGSLVLATPFLRAARARFPNAEIHLLTLSSNREITAMMKELDQVHFLNLGGNIFSAIAAFSACLIKTFQGGYDVLIDMEFYTRASAVVSLASWAPMRIGFHSRGVYRGDIPSHRVPFNAYWHVTKNFLSLLEPFGQTETTDALVPSISVHPELLKDARAVLERLGGNKPRFIVINANAGELAYERRWLPDRFAQLAARLSSHYDVSCIFIGAPGEKDYVQGIVDEALAQGAKALNTAGQLNLEAMAQMCRESLLVISNDSGPLHVAAAVGASIVGFFGPETPVLYGPVGDGHLVFHQSLSCSPCINIEQSKHLKCWHPSPICQERTSVEQAFKAICTAYDAVLSAP